MRTLTLIEESGIISFVLESPFLPTQDRVIGRIPLVVAFTGTVGTWRASLLALAVYVLLADPKNTKIIESFLTEKLRERLSGETHTQEKKDAINVLSLLLKYHPFFFLLLREIDQALEWLLEKAVRLVSEFQEAKNS